MAITHCLFILFQKTSRVTARGATGKQRAFNMPETKTTKLRRELDYWRSELMRGATERDDYKWYSDGEGQEIRERIEQIKRELRERGHCMDCGGELEQNNKQGYCQTCVRERMK